MTMALRLLMGVYVWEGELKSEEDVDWGFSAYMGEDNGDVLFYGVGLFPCCID